MLLASLVAAPVSADDTRNHAGRTLTLTSADAEADNEIACQWAAYGKVNSQRVLFTANHCFSDKANAPRLENYYDGRTIVDEDGRAHGTTPTSATQCSATYDLCYIYLLPGRWPSNPHQIFAGRDSLGLFRWSTISTYQGSSDYDCNSNYLRVGQGVHEYQQDVQTGLQLPYSGRVTGYQGSGWCALKTDIPASTTYRHSGSPLMNCDYGGTCSLIGVGTWNEGGMWYASARQGILAIDAYWQTRGFGSGAKFCTTAAC